jgi:hypothetical protein
VTVYRRGRGALDDASDRGGSVEAEPQEQDTKAGDPPKEQQADENPARQGPGEGTGPSGAPAPDDAEQGPSGPPPESIPGDSGEVPNPSQN